MESHQGRLPRSYEELNSLPGVGEYTANALLAFAYNKPTIVLETNIRTALIHHFFKNDEKVSDKQLKMKLAELLERVKNPREWYYALMDYGNWLKSEGFDYFHKQNITQNKNPLKDQNDLSEGGF
jgi:A/G-specific adenine glycosylase